MDGLTAQETDFFQFLLGTSEVGSWMRSRALGVQYYVVSLTEESDLLSQWRAYASKSGYCVGWSTNVLKSSANHNGFDLQPCIYDIEVQRTRIKPIVEGALQRWRASPCDISFADSFWMPRDDAQDRAYVQLSRYQRDFDVEFGKIATACKYPAFHEKREWRLVSHEDPRGHAPRVEFREGRSVLIPYIAFTIELNSVAQEEQLTSIVCGPSPEIDLAQMSAVNLFATAGWTGTHTSQSRVPYRDW